MAADTWGQPGDPFSGADFLKGVAKYGFGTSLGDRGSNTRDAKAATRMSAFEKAYLQQQSRKNSGGTGGSAGGYQDLGGGNTVWRQAQPGMFTIQGTPGKKGFGSAIGAGLGAIVGTVVAPGLGTAAGARIGGGIGGGVDSYMYS
jgi:hypothetical protein